MRFALSVFGILLVGLGFAFAREGLWLGYVLAALGVIVLLSFLAKHSISEWRETLSSGQSVAQKHLVVAIPLVVVSLVLILVVKNCDIAWVPLVTILLLLIGFAAESHYASTREPRPGRQERDVSDVLSLTAR